MDQPRPVIVWFRRDLRLGDHAALRAALDTGQPVIPVFIHDETVEALGAAARWRLGKSVEALGKRLAARGSRLILRRGPALKVLTDLISETGAGAVHWQRTYDRDGIARDKAVKARLTQSGITAKSFPGALLHEPWQVQTGSGGPYRVYSPFWRTIRGLDPGAPLPAPSRIPAPQDWPRSEHLDDWRMGQALRRGEPVVAAHAVIGEDAARDRLERFIAERMARYPQDRDRPDLPGTSDLSENLAWGEISPRVIWHRTRAAIEEGDAAAAKGGEKFLSELAWRDFAWHLLYHAPDMDRRNWRPEWDGFPWRGDNDDAERWRRGITGEPFVDAAMRQMYVTGRMHNRARMIVASYLTKHLLTDWRVGLAWFADCLTDWDPASNAMGWQWVAGCGPDAAPYFRVFNPATQAEKFDPKGAYRRAWIAEGQKDPPETARSWFKAVPRSWGLSPDAPYPAPMIDLKAGRERALAAYAARKAGESSAI
ncbi:deoxyribodipyrimidine photo-lyase [Albidovulum inexpectatum]|uniref:Deoxyribodipyrimidine photo-lyase n=1 Tax=Albidovulum inexpectatum TaxID=196587 RepID=A0A2S5JIS7_9RHOB|nr:deoxyribodipyrimidine photo-lyase [Albidovulum inexpectatum]PPB81340.1 deoxyribodipyrimidine photo-lyase [Albidovulum inexpectatum]